VRALRIAWRRTRSRVLGAHRAAALRCGWPIKIAGNVLGLLFAALMFLISAGAWAGLAWLLTTVPPSEPFAVATAYIFAFVGVSGSGALVIWLGLRRARSPAAYLAHSMLLAVIVLFAFWLQSLRTLTPIVAVLLFGLYAFLELAVLFGTRGSVELPLKR
jgi:hypothetical protein